MIPAATFIGFGEAGRAFAWQGARAFDSKVLDEASREEMLAAMARAGVEAASDAAAALADARLVLSLVTADQAVPAAHSYAPHLAAGALWLDMNSIAPGSKRRAAEVIEAAGGCYVDVAVMAPVMPARRSVPLLVAGPHAGAAAQMLADLGFSSVACAGPAVGDASTVKMIRSVMVKGIEALSAECALAAHRAGISDSVFGSLDASWKEQGWAARIDHGLDRMLAHGLRRAAEMEEVALTLEELGVDPVMTRSTIARQRQFGTLGLTPPDGLDAKLAALETPEAARAA